MSRFQLSGLLLARLSKVAQLAGLAVCWCQL
jgi:hypothetical protein